MSITLTVSVPPPQQRVEWSGGGGGGSVQTIWFDCYVEAENLQMFSRENTKVLNIIVCIV